MEVMQVPGKTVSSSENRKFCQPCSDDDLQKDANGLCNECDEYMCNACFDKHKRWKVTRHHTLTGLEETSPREKIEFVKCAQHLQEPVRFYCDNHKKVGCGDCMIINHNGCQVEYIIEKTKALKDSREFKEYVFKAEQCQNDAGIALSSIKENKAKAGEMNEKFRTDVNEIKDKIIEHVNELASQMIKQADDITTSDLNKLEEMEKKNENLTKDISGLTDNIQLNIDKPYKMFLSMVDQQEYLNGIRDHLDLIKNGNTIVSQEFKPDDNLVRTVFDCKQLGSISMAKKVGGTEQVKEAVLSEPTNQTNIETATDTNQNFKDSNKSKPETKKDKSDGKVAEVHSRRNLTSNENQRKEEKTDMKEQYKESEVQKSQPLLDRQILCKNLTITGDILSYKTNEQAGVGLFVDKRQFRIGDSFEIQILEMGRKDSIALGTVWKDKLDNFNGLPGECNLSCGYRSDGKFFRWRNDQGIQGSQWTKGDRIKCTVKDKFLGIIFEHNGKDIGCPYYYGVGYFAIGMKSKGDRVKVIF